ncbi:MAG: NAD(P)H-dependent glycerol-3-phosphate dehydrogenase [Candidatus Marinimicrobia bacterium]|jgi:glycerol-3-phosphate dehydrogenase (NAD(P)+)|nr:NAD(P)H-dependent glycerol-3-phosphate dehydrogenase [Candidatus Neomarinimicrobiota bacterium]
MKISIVGAGSWGTALGQVLSENGHEPLLWHHNPEFVEEISTTHCHPFLSEYALHPALKFTHSLEETTAFSDILISALPSQVVRQVFSNIPELKVKIIVSVSKGIEMDTGQRMSQVFEDILQIDSDAFVVLSGPSHAEEVIQKFPTTVVAAGTSLENARTIQTLFSNTYFRVYTGADVAGVEIGGAAKNIIALAAGICQGLGFGDNTMAALVTRGLEEIIRLGTTLGGKRETISGLSGMGDLVVTAFSPHSRNRQVGQRIGKGETLQSILASMEMVAEGVSTTKSLYTLAQTLEVDMPICRQIYRVLYEGLVPRDGILELMSRELVDEHPL